MVLIISNENKSKTISELYELLNILLNNLDITCEVIGDTIKLNNTDIHVVDIDKAKYLLLSNEIDPSICIYSPSSAKELYEFHSECKDTKDIDIIITDFKLPLNSISNIDIFDTIIHNCGISKKVDIKKRNSESIENTYVI